MEISRTRLITVVEAAEIIGLSRSKVYELLAEGHLPSIRIGRTRRINVTDLDAFIEQHRVPAIPASKMSLGGHGSLETEDAR